MIQPKDLRIGNLFYPLSQGEIYMPIDREMEIVELMAFKVRSIRSNEIPAQVENWTEWHYKEITGIEIKDKLLLRLGFKLEEKGYRRGNLVINDLGTTCRAVYCNIFIRDLKYIHEVQNLNYWLTGEDLTFEL
jgi:hypothetical protein